MTHPHTSKLDGVQVKPLEWKTYDGRSTEYAETILGTYSVWAGHFRRPNDYGGTAANDPKAAAQADFERQILSCLSLPQPNQIENGGEAVALTLNLKIPQAPAYSYRDLDDFKWLPVVLDGMTGVSDYCVLLPSGRRQNIAQEDYEALAPMTSPPELTIDEAMVERAARAMAFDEWQLATDAERQAWADKHWPRYAQPARVALTAAFKGGE